jgi:hypothetical protein
MKALVRTNYWPAEILQRQEVEQPTPHSLLDRRPLIIYFLRRS